jgi:hypothetical protein
VEENVGMKKMKGKNVVADTGGRAVYGVCLRVARWPGFWVNTL